VMRLDIQFDTRHGFVDYSFLFFANVLLLSEMPCQSFHSFRRRYRLCQRKSSSSGVDDALVVVMMTLLFATRPHSLPTTIFPSTNATFLLTTSCPPSFCSALDVRCSILIACVTLALVSSSCIHCDLSP